MNRKPYCIAPWVDSHVTADGFRSACCAATESFSYETLAEWWQSPELRELRLQMLDGKPPVKTCQTCITNTRDVSLASMMNRDHKGLMEIADENTDEKGFTTLMPKTLEIKHILCNLKCRHCFDRSSSTIRAKAKIFNIQKIEPFGAVYKADELTLSDKVNDIDWIDKNTMRVTWTGGEPFMSPLLMPYLKKMLSFGGTNIHQVVITNAMFKNKKPVLEALDLLKQFRHNTMIFSCDGLHEIGAFSRTGWEHDTFVANVKLIQDALRFNTSFQFNFVLHAISVQGMYDTVKFCIDNNIKFKSQLVNSYGPHHLDYNLVKREVYENEFARCQSLIKERNSDIELDIIDTFRNVYSPRVINDLDWAELDYSCKLRGGTGEYQILMKDGFLNE